MKIFHLALTTSPETGYGAVRYGSERCRALARAGHEVHLLTLGIRETREGEGSGALAAHSTGTGYPFFAYNEYLQSALLNIPVAEKAVELWESEGPFDLLSADGWTGSLAAHLARKVFGVPWVLTLHGTRVGAIGGKGTREEIYAADMERWAAEEADGVVVPSRFVRSEVVRHYRIPKERIWVVPGGVREDAFRTDVDRDEFRLMFGEPDDRLLLFAGRLAPEKGPDLLLEAMPRILRSRSAARLIFAGDGPMKDGLAARSRELGLEERVRFTGAVGAAVLGALYQVADLFLLPSRYEAFGISAVEAALHGIPIVACQAGGVGELAELLGSGKMAAAPPGDPAALAEVVVTALPAKRKPRGHEEASQARIPRKLLWETVARETLGIYEEILAHSTV